MKDYLHNPIELIYISMKVENVLVVDITNCKCKWQQKRRKIVICLKSTPFGESDTKLSFCRLGT